MHNVISVFMLFFSIHIFMCVCVGGGEGGGGKNKQMSKYGKWWVADMHSHLC